MSDLTDKYVVCGTANHPDAPCYKQSGYDCEHMSAHLYDPGQCTRVCSNDYDGKPCRPATDVEVAAARLRGAL